ncbi:thioredoxin family protein [Mesorhizobium sp. KR1-2]|uniref:thioredoxin family protein n=1 Tax=Mesorhizobium sp. KR1-2 TaxID=3156609 RepID=UPI0032B4AF5D
MQDSRPSPRLSPGGGHEECSFRLRRALVLGLPVMAGASLLARPVWPAVSAPVVTSLAEYRAALDALAPHKTAALVDIGAKWCAFCRTIDTKILPDRQVMRLLEHVGLIKVDVTAMDDANRELLRHLRADGPPTLFIVQTATGQEYRNTRSVGSFRTGNLVARLQPFAS